MVVNYMILGFTAIFLAATFFHYKYTRKKGIEFRYKPLTLVIIGLLFLLSLYGIITGKPYNEIVPFIR